MRGYIAEKVAQVPNFEIDRIHRRSAKRDRAHDDIRLTMTTIFLSIVIDIYTASIAH